MGTKRNDIKRAIQQPFGVEINWSSFDVKFDNEKEDISFTAKILLNPDNVPFIKINDLLTLSGYAQGNVKVNRIISSGITYPNIVVGRHREDVVENMYINIYCLNILKGVYPLIKSEEIASKITSTIFTSNHTPPSSKLDVTLEEIKDMLEKNNNSIASLIKERDLLEEENDKLRTIINNISNVISDFS
jgi:hypothetical protein